MLKYFEWEYGNQNIELGAEFEVDEEFSFIQKILISRNSDYGINCMTSVKEDHNNINMDLNAKEFRISQFGNVFSFRDVYIDKYSKHYSYYPNKFEGKVNLICREVMMEKVEKKEDKILTEWYINAPKDLMIYKISSEIIEEKIYKVKRYGIDEWEIKDESAGSFRRDCIKIDCDDFSFMIKKVNDDYEPNFSSKIGIEYRADFGGIPNEQIRKAIGEIVGFLIGKQIINIGNTSYCENYEVNTFKLLKPSISNIVSECNMSEMPPLNLNPYKNGVDIENTFSTVINNYLDKKSKFLLDHSIWNYWISKYTPIGSNLPILASGIETIINQWFKENRNVRLEYIEDGQFMNIISKAIEAVEKDLKENEYSDRIIRKIKSSNKMSGNEKTDLFYKEIGIVLNKKENKAIKERNPMVHGRIYSVSNEYKKAIEHTRVYITLYNKIILKLLEYNGKIIDYSETGCLEIDI